MIVVHINSDQGLGTTRDTQLYFDSSVYGFTLKRVDT